MKEPIRVLQVIGIMNRGGAETMIMNLYRQIDHKKIQFDFVENENDDAFFDEEIRFLGGKIYHCPRFTGNNYWKYKNWWKKFFNEHNEYSIVHGHIGSTAAIYLNEAKGHGIVTIAHSHNINGKGLKQFFYNILSYPVRNIADYLFVCSKQAGISRYGEKAAFDTKRTFLVPNAIDIELFRFNAQSRINKRKEFGITDEECLIGHVGRFAEQKNHAFLLDVFNAIVQLYPSAKLLLVGDGELHSFIEEKIDLLNLKDRVILTGTRSDISELMDAMDVLLFPSKYEGLPVTLVEAQCNGLPCVISNMVPEDSVLIKDLVHIRSLSDDPSIWAETTLHCNHIERLKCADKIKVTGFNIEKSAQWLEGFYLDKSK